MYSRCVGFDVAADSYDRFMGRFSEPLAERFAMLLPLTPGQRALDVGCGPGALTSRLVEALGCASVAAIDPSEPFVAAARARFPDADIRIGSSEHLPFSDGTFGLTAAQLVVHFMADPIAGIAEMRRVTTPGGMVAASVWDFAGERAPLSLFWRAVRVLSPHAVDESGLPGARDGHLTDLFEAAGLSAVTSSTMTVTLTFATFDDWWSPFLLGVGPAGAYVEALDAAARELLRSECTRLVGDVPFSIEATAWVATGRA